MPVPRRCRGSQGVPVPTACRRARGGVGSWRPQRSRGPSFKEASMAANASQALGASQVAGTYVNPRGMAKKMVTRVAASQAAGMVGGVAAGVATGSERAGVADSPDFGRDAYLAVSERDLALVKTKQGVMKLKITDEVIARAPRSEVTSAQVGDGKLACPLTISFANGATWEMDVPRAGKRAAKAVVTALGG